MTRPIWGQDLGAGVAWPVVTAVDMKAFECIHTTSLSGRGLPELRATEPTSDLARLMLQTGRGRSQTKGAGCRTMWAFPA